MEGGTFDEKTHFENFNRFSNNVFCCGVIRGVL